MLWRASEWSIRQSVGNAMAVAHEKGFPSIAFLLVGAEIYPQTCDTQSPSHSPLPSSGVIRSINASPAS